MFYQLQIFHICDQKCDKSPVKTDEYDHPDLTPSNFMGNSIRHRVLLMLDISVSDLTKYSDHSPITAYFALKHIDLVHTGQCKRTGGCYNELVVAFYSTGGGVKGK